MTWNITGWETIELDNFSLLEDDVKYFVDEGVIKYAKEQTTFTIWGLCEDCEVTGVLRIEPTKWYGDNTTRLYINKINYSGEFSGSNFYMFLGVLERSSKQGKLVAVQHWEVDQGMTKVTIEGGVNDYILEDINDKDYKKLQKKDS